MKCEKCDGQAGSLETYKNQVCMPFNGKVICVDHCIHQIVAALNAGGVPTVACCCGHGTQDGRIDLEDGRVLIIRNDLLNNIEDLDPEFSKAIDEELWNLI